MSLLYIDTTTGQPFGSLAYLTSPAISAIQGMPLEISCAFALERAVIALPADATGRLVIKAPLDHDGPTVLTDTAWQLTGSGTFTRYTFSLVAQSLELAELLVGRDTLALPAQIEWSVPGSDQPLCSLPFSIHFISSYLRPEDGLPTASLHRAFAWMRATLLAGSNIGITVNEQNKTLTLNAAGGSGNGGGTGDHGQLIGLDDDDHPQYHNHTRGDLRYSPLGHTHTPSQVGLGNVPNMTLAQVKTAVLTDAGDLFAAKAHTHSKASLGLGNVPNMTLAEITAAVASAIGSGGSGGGGAVTLQSELISPTGTVATGTFYAFTLPRNFAITDLYMTLALDTQDNRNNQGQTVAGEGSLLTGHLLQQDITQEIVAQSVLSFTGLRVTQGICQIPRVGVGYPTLTSGTRISLQLTGVSSTTYQETGVLRGLQLWIMGVWI